MSLDSIDFILAALTSIPVGTTFGRGEKNLDARLHQVVYNRFTRGDNLVREYFSVHPQHGYCKEVDDAFASFDILSLDSIGPDGKYIITPLAHQRGRESLRRFNPEEQEYIIKFGRELIELPVAA